jgi:deoxyribonuclease (pyrimidine dimer)
MTRINVGIAPTNLPDELLLAELREIKRLPYFKRTLKDQTPPQEFTLGKGHIKFFMTRLRYAKERYRRLKEEAERRGFMVTDFSQNFDGLGENEEEWWPEVKDKEKIIERIIQRVRESKKKCWHYYGKRITKEEVMRRLEG